MILIVVVVCNLYVCLLHKLYDCTYVNISIGDYDRNETSRIPFLSSGLWDFAYHPTPLTSIVVLEGGSDPVVYQNLLEEPI
jgi:hypothetical protein